MEKGGFTYVGRKGGAEHSRRRRATHKTRDARLRSTPPLDESAKADDGQANPPQLAVLHERVERAVAELRPSDILARLLDAIRSAPATEPARLLSCFGIASFAHEPAARYQVALSLLLHESLSGAAMPLPFDSYDPVFSRLERSLLESRSCRVPDRNEEGRRLAEATCLFCMPHRGRQLYANRLRANWSSSGLARLLIVGNSLVEYADAMGSVERALGGPIARAATVVTERALGEAASSGSGAYANAFCSLSLHVFEQSRLPGRADA